MGRHLAYNPGRDSVEYLEAITCGARGRHILEQLLISLRGEIGRANHQHHLLLGPRGAGKTHLLRLLTAGRLPADPLLATAYLPVVMPEETALRSPADLFLKFVERLAELLKAPPADLAPDKARKARAICMTALASAKGIRDPLDRLEVAADALAAVAQTVERILLAVAENMDQTLYLGAQTTRKGPQAEQWALRRHLQASPHLLLIAAAPTTFGAAGSPGQAFYDFFRTHQLEELSPDEVLEVIRLRLEHEAAHPVEDGLRGERVRCLLERFSEKAPGLRGILAITGGLPRFVHLIYEVLVQSDLQEIMGVLDDFLDEMTPYFQNRMDPRLIPQPEVDLLHTLALARGPQQPTELAAQLYGVGTNEVSELLGRLQERGLVKRAGRPGGKAVTWDLTEPLYRVWTQFRDNPSAQEGYQLLAEFVAVLFSLDEIENEREHLARELELLPTGCGQQKGFRLRCKLLENARDQVLRYEQARETPKELLSATRAESFDKSLVCTRVEDVANGGDAGSTAERLKTRRSLTQVHPKEAGPREERAKELVRAIEDAGEAGDADRSSALLEELHTLSSAHLEEISLREWLAKGLFNTLNDATAAGDTGRSLARLEELRTLSGAHPEEVRLRELLASGLVNAIGDAVKAGEAERSYALLEELRTLSGAHPDEVSLRERLAKGLVNALSNAAKAGEAEQSQALLEELLESASRHPDQQAVGEIIQRATLIFGRSLLVRMQRGDVDSARESFRAVEAKMPLELAAFLRPITLAMDVLEKGDEQALAREPEEMRRVVKMLLASVERKTTQGVE